MKKLHVLINCPGGWSHGLDSPERGEGRWAQNLARLLAIREECEVFACSGGDPTWGRGRRAPVTLMAESAAAREQYDIYIDSSWWDGKAPVATARANLHVHWGVESYMIDKPLPSGHFLAYVYRQSAPEYITSRNVNLDRTLYLPATFGATMKAGDPSARDILSFSRGGDVNAPQLWHLYEAVTRLRQTWRLFFTWLDHPSYPRPAHADDVLVTYPQNEPWGIPYCEQMARADGAGVNISFGGGGSIADCAVAGVPSIIREDNFAMLREVAEAHDLLLPFDCPVDDVEHCVRRLYDDPITYRRYIAALQDVYVDHTDDRVLALWRSATQMMLP